MCFRSSSANASECDGRAYRMLAGDAISYVTMFEITHDSSLWWWPWVFVPLAQGLLATVILLLTRNMGPTTKIVRILVFLYACLLMVLVGYNLRIRRHYVEAYRNGKYKVVEGRVEH